MTNLEIKYSSPVNKLFSYGDCRDFKEWPDYLKLGFTEEHIPELIKMATDEELNFADSEEPEVWAPAHAWRTLGQLKAKEAIEPLITLFYVLEDDDWADEELPTVFAMIGSASLPSLARYLADPSRGTSSRITAASCINQVGVENKSETSNCIALFTSQLEKYENNPPEVNGFLVWFLIDFDALDSMPVIKEAYERNCVDETIVGTFSEVEYHFGLTDNPPKLMLFAEESNTPLQGKISVGRNDPCPCGSGKKYKKCCLNKI